MSMEATKEEQQQDVLMQLYDLYWFKHHIFSNQSRIEEVYPNPKLFHKTPYLHPIRSLSDQSVRRRARRCCGICKSLLEIKGFIDLGFEFSEEDKRCPRLVSILPGLQRLGSNEGNGLEAMEGVLGMSYLSQVWRVRKKPFLLMKKMEKNLRLPASLCDEDEMKKHIKMWAQAVASIVRYEHEFVSISSSKCLFGS